MNDIANAVHPTTANSSLSGTNQPTAITASFTPAVALQQAAADCGVREFDWQQIITNLPPGGPGRKDGEPIITPIYDPQPDGGWNYTGYCSATYNPPNGVPSLLNPVHATFFNPSRENPYPFYYDPNPNLPSTDCGSLASHTGIGSLDFFDSPVDPAGLADPLRFNTCLVGVSNDGFFDPESVPNSYNDCFNWSDTFTGVDASCSDDGITRNCTVTGTQGGGILIPQLNSAVNSGYPGLGQGGIELQNAQVPEPRSITTVVTGIIIVLLFRWRERAKRDVRALERAVSGKPPPVDGLLAINAHVIARA
jgi:hypothetical protein